MQKIRSFFKSIKFLGSFIMELGGVGKLVVKTVNTFREDGFDGAIKKSSYILSQARLTSRRLSPQHAYKKWLKQYDEISEKHRAEMQAATSEFKHQPLISIVLPTYNTKPKWLKAAIGSVKNQIYQNWELCIADDASYENECIEILKFYQNSDQRIKVEFRENNGHISQASNTALALATGEWTALLDHDDLFHESALFRVVETINQHPQAQLIYSDEDKINKKGKRTMPYFKCDWNYHLFLSQNMISHLGVYKTEVIKAIGGFREGYEGSQDYDLALRYIEQISHHHIFHIPRILYHWRTHDQSTSVNADTKPYAVISGKKALEEHLKRKQVKAKVEIQPSNMYRVKYQLPEKKPRVTIIIPGKNNKIFLEKCINSLMGKTTYPDYEIIIINNNSTEPESLEYYDQISQMANVRVLEYNKPFNFSAINNWAVENTDNELICFLNDDIEVITEEWLSEMVSLICQPEVAVVGARLLYPDDSVQHAGVVLGMGGVASHVHKFLSKNDLGYFGRGMLVQEFSAVTAACMLIKKSIFLEAGKFDEKNLKIAFNDVDLCLKIKELKYKIVWTPFAELYHHESVSRGDDLHPLRYEEFMKESEFMHKKWGHYIQNDPAYSPNLSLATENFNLAWPPRVKEFTKP